MIASANRQLAKAAAASKTQPEPPPAKINKSIATHYVNPLGYSLVKDGNAKAAAAAALAAKPKKAGAPRRSPAVPKEPCRLFAAGNCTFGASCKFSHDAAPPPRGTPAKDGAAGKGRGKGGKGKKGGKKRTASPHFPDPNAYADDRPRFT